MKRERPWIMRIYAGQSDCETTNALFRNNLAKGQTGLSVAFDLPTQMGRDSDHPLAQGEVGRTGVPICTIEDMEQLFAGIPLDAANTSMTINATAAWLLALYIAVAERQGVNQSRLRGTTQNDILKEYESRHTYIFPPEPSLAIMADVVEYAVKHIPNWNPTNLCSYHLQEAGATPVQEVAITLANAFLLLDRVRTRRDVSMPDVVGRISFFVDAGIRFVEEICKLKAFARLWDRYALERYGVNDLTQRRFRFGVQVNSINLQAQQPENNVQRICFELLAATLSSEARARSVQLPAWNEAGGLPRPQDQQWSLRIQQVLAYESDLLEYGDIFDGSTVIENKVQAMMIEVEQELGRLQNINSVEQFIETVDQAIWTSFSERCRRIKEGEVTVVGVNKFQESEFSPVLASASKVAVVNPGGEQKQVERLRAFRAKRNLGAVASAILSLEDAVKSGSNIMGASIKAAQAGVTTGEWADTLRKVFGEYQITSRF